MEQRARLDRLATRSRRKAGPALTEAKAEEHAGMHSTKSPEELTALRICPDLAGLKLGTQAASFCPVPQSPVVIPAAVGGTRTPEPHERSMQGCSHMAQSSLGCNTQFHVDALELEVSRVIQTFNVWIWPECRVYPADPLFVIGICARAEHIGNAMRHPAVKMSNLRDRRNNDFASLPSGYLDLCNVIDSTISWVLGRRSRGSPPLRPLL